MKERVSMKSSRRIALISLLIVAVLTSGCTVLEYRLGKRIDQLTEYMEPVKKLDTLSPADTVLVLKKSDHTVYGFVLQIQPESSITVQPFAADSTDVVAWEQIDQVFRPVHRNETEHWRKEGIIFGVLHDIIGLTIIALLIYAIHM